MDLEEKTRSSERIYEGKIIKVRIDEVLLPDGKQSKREIVEHSGAVAILPVDEQNHIWMVRQYRKAVEQVLLEIPAGTLEIGEDPLDCARRELEEETGLRADTWEKLLEYYCAPGFCDEKSHIYIARNFSAGMVNPDGDEFLEVVQLPLKAAYELIFKGQIIDGKSIIAIQHAYHEMVRD